MEGKMNYKYFLLALIIISTIGCSSLSRVDHIPIKLKEQRTLIVFFDGTANDEGSYTNIAKLRNLVTLQNRTDVSTTYIKGVGTGSKIIGMGMGWGIGNDVREAYLYLIDNYDSMNNDQIIIFGFSRGAYASRILTALLNVAGIPNLKNLTESEKRRLVKDIYAAYKYKYISMTTKYDLNWIVGENDEKLFDYSTVTNSYKITDRRISVANILKDHWRDKMEHTLEPVNVRFLGLWDTVEALGWPDREENIDEPNQRYADQLCNVNAASHAVSIDDNRARIFTPLLISRKHLQSQCGDKIFPKDKFNEVWFSGAHSDVGGGYSDTNIDGISLNWMLDEVKKEGLQLVGDDTSVYADYLGKTHNPEGGLAGLIYRKRIRNIPCYSEMKNLDDGSCRTIPKSKGYANGSTKLSYKINIHQSVVDRLCVKPPENFESFWFKTEKYKNCLTCDKYGKGIITDKKLCTDKIDIVGDGGRYKKRNNKLGDINCNYSACLKAIGSEFKKVKSCNFDHQYILERAKQRLETKIAKDSDTIIIYADVENDKTGIFLSKNKSYKFRIHESEVWVDCTIESANPETGRLTWDSTRPFSENIFSLIGKPLAYAPTRGYTELLGVVANQQFALGHIAANGTAFTPDEDGELIIRVNEPKYFSNVYENNSGVLKLTINSE